MKTVSENISVPAEPATAAGYFQLCKDFERKFAEGSWAPVRNLKAAVLSSFTLNGIKEILTAKCALAGIRASVYTAPYKQWAQEILNPSSALYEFSPAFVTVFIDTASLLGESALRPYASGPVDWRTWKDRQFEEIQGFMTALKSRMNGIILLHNFEVPHHSPLGILENKHDFGFVEAVEVLNHELRESFKKDSQVYLFDLNGFLSKTGKETARDPKMLYLADMKLDLQKLPDLAEEYMAYVRPLAGLARKCLVLDLDNTLWGGIAGEDGIDGIRLGPTPEGRPFLEFQQMLAALYDRGVVLAVNSRNNPEEALAIIRNHPHMVLKEEHFASMQINWVDKVTNLKAIAAELNLGLESFVFVDDDPANRAVVRQALPEVKVVDLPEDPARYVQALTKIYDFNTMHLTAEDLQKGRIYAEEKKRRDHGKSSGDLSAWLRALETEVTVEDAGEFTIPRIAQLTQKTNQFNMTARRYQQEDIIRFAGDPAFRVFSAAVRDKYGDSGITAAVIIKTGAGIWEIDTFLMSCRVIGRGIEDSLMACLLEDAKKNGVRRILGEFIPTAKNAPARGFYERCGFECTGKKGETETWQRDPAASFKAPDFIKLNVKEKI